MKTAIVHDWLTFIGGGEKTLERMYESFPSPIYTLVKDDDVVGRTALANADIRTSFIQRLPMSRRKYRYYLPLFPLAIEQFDLGEYDVILSSSHCVAKGVLSRPDQLHICYCYSPVRYAWDLYFNYLRESNLTRGVKSFLVKGILHRLRIWDVVSSHRVTHFVAISEYIARRINHLYGRDADVIYPPVDIDLFDVGTRREDFYLAASRMVPYKMMPLIVRSFSRMPDRRLVVIGGGPELPRLRRIASKNVEILGHQPFEVLREHLQTARAFVFAAEEDFGILPVEAQACGTPVIAFGRGGVRETVLPGKSGILFERQEEESLIDAIRSFEMVEDSFDRTAIRRNAERFDRRRFQREFETYVNDRTRDFYS